MIKYYLAHKENDANVSAYFNFIFLINDLMFCVLFAVDAMLGFQFEANEFYIATIGGILFSSSSYIMAYVNIRGKAGTSDALIETCVIYQTILDAIVYGRTPNTLQIISMFIGFLATLLLLWGHTK